MAITTKKRTSSKAKKPLTKKEKDHLKACKANGGPTCPAVSGVDSPYMYQTGCRGEACKLANRNYYKAWRDKTAKKAARKARAKKATKKTAKSTSRKRTTAKRKTAKR